MGGTQVFWENDGYFHGDGIEVTLLNVENVQVTRANFRCVNRDARNMKQFKDKEFDVVFSNSVIEHVGGYADQQKMANEIQRVGKRYFVQTPNRSFPIEPHFLFPFFQFLPERICIWLLTNYNI